MKQQNMNLFFKKGWMLFFVALILASCSETADYSHLTDISGGSPFDPSKPIEVTDFMPKKGGVGTRLIVYGNNFGNDTTKLRVTIGGKAAPVINTLGTSLLCMVPEKAFTEISKYRLSMTILSRLPRVNVPTSLSTSVGGPCPLS